jgi:hypothetical protein
MSRTAVVAFEKIVVLLGKEKTTRLALAAL